MLHIHKYNYVLWTTHRAGLTEYHLIYLGTCKKCGKKKWKTVVT